ncbi:glyco_transf_64 domain-containing protein, partial [Haematococcus lacustris]
MNKKLRILQRVALGLLWTACIYATLELLVSASHWALDSGSQHAGICTKDDEGQWAIGIYKGPSPFSLRPPERWPRPQADTAAAWPVANPVYSCAHVTDVPSSFVADPFLWPAEDGQLFMFYETKSVHNMQ